jgi:hypothetical protein
LGDAVHFALYPHGKLVRRSTRARLLERSAKHQENRRTLALLRLRAHPLRTAHHLPRPRRRPHDPGAAPESRPLHPLHLRLGPGDVGNLFLGPGEGSVAAHPAASPHDSSGGALVRPHDRARPARSAGGRHPSDRSFGADDLVADRRQLPLRCTAHRSAQGPAPRDDAFVCTIDLRCHGVGDAAHREHRRGTTDGAQNTSRHLG